LIHIPQIPPFLGQDLRLQEPIAKHTRGRGRGRASRIRPKLLLRPFIPPTLLQSIALPPPGEDHTSDPSPISGMMAPDAIPLPPIVSPPTGSQGPIPEMQPSPNNDSVSTPEIRPTSAMSHPPPLDNHEYPPIPALNFDGTYLGSPVEQSLGVANPVASLSIGTTGGWSHEARPHHLDSPPGYTGALSQDYPLALDGHLGGDIPCYPQFMGLGIAGSSRTQDMGVASGERMRPIPDHNFVRHWGELEGNSYLYNF